MKKILSIFMSIVMLLSITAGADLSAQASEDIWEYESNDNPNCADLLDFGQIIHGYTSASDIDLFAINLNTSINFKVYFNHDKDYTYGCGWYLSLYKYDDYTESYLDTNGLQFNYSKYSYYDSVKASERSSYSNNIVGRKGDKYLLAVRSSYGGSHQGDVEYQISLKADISKPSNVKVSSNSSSGFNVNWSKVANVDGYLIKYATKSDFSNAAMVKVANGKATSKTINGRAANTKYYVKVQAYKKVNGTTYKSKWSETKAVRTLQKKNRITSITAKPNGFTVKWEKMNGKLGYQIRYATRSDFSNAATIYAGNGKATSKTVTGRARRTKYYVQVRSYVKQSNGKYKFDAWSPAKTVTTK